MTVRQAGTEPVSSCTGGFGSQRLTRGTNCATCGMPAGLSRIEHCYLYQRCDNCYSDTDPCQAALSIRELLK